MLRTMELMNKRPDLVAEQWKQQYCKNGKWLRLMVGGKSEVVYNKLVEAAGDIDKIEAVIGNQSWTRLFCGECSEYADVGVLIGDDQIVCRKCLVKALEMCGAE